MTPEQLKASILQYAIQGKLVEQRPEEGNAEELYKHIQKEKQTLIKEGKIKKEKSLAEITEDEIPFDIPQSWKWVKHNDLFEIVGGSQPPKSNFKEYPEEGDVRLFQIRDYGETPVPIYVDKKLVSKFTIKGDILLARYGGSLGKVFWAKEGAYNVALAKIVMLYKTELIDKNFLYYYYLAPLYQNFVKGSNRAAQGGFNKDDLNNLLFPLPPLAEQYRIVAKIEKLLPFVDRYAASYEKLEQFNAKFPEDMKKSILQYAIQGKLVEQRPEEGSAEELYKAIQEEKQKLIKEGKLKKTRALPLITEEEIPFDFPKTWKICYIDDIAFVTKLAGFEYTKYIADNLVIDGIPLFKGKNVQNGKLVLEFESFIPESVSDELPRSQITKKCLLTPYVGTIGNIAIFDGTFKAHLGSNVGKIEILNSNDNTFVLEEYLLWYLRSQYGYNELTKYKKATAQESISIDAIRNVIIAIPPLEEQHRIVAKIEELLPYCDRLVKRC